jgi:two-component system sensor histidine kinase PilS (NtrC family)
MSGSIQMLSRDLSNNETHEKLMRIILRGKDQLEGFLKDFLLMARPAPGVREEIDIGEMIRDVLESLQCASDWPEPVRIDLRLKEARLFIQMNRNESRQVLWNVILNALQAMPEGGTLTVEARGCRKDERDGIEILIRDTGCGIEESQLPKIFEPFYTTRDTGTGLGLAVVNRILEAYRGKIDIQSDPGRGTTCTIWMPCRYLPEDGNRIIS